MNKTRKLNFAVGPVMSSEPVCEIGGGQIPYFRTPEFSQIMFANERRIKNLMGATDSSKVVFLTGSGTAAMEATVINTLNENDKALIVDGGSFGHRFCQICEVHGIPHDVIVCESGKTLTADQLAPYEKKGYTSFLVNLCETSTGVLYDLPMISEFCKRNGLFLIIDAVSAFLCDELDMTKYGVNAVMTGSQKALALAPGISIVCLDETALERIEKNNVKSLYFNFKDYLLDMQRGQTPFTPAVGVLLQLDERLKYIDLNGGIAGEIARTAARADYFRARINDFPVSYFADKMSNSVTALCMTDKSRSAYSVFEKLKDEYGIYICPNGGALRDTVFRVGHLGDLTFNDYDVLLKAMRKVFA